jgi:hypothetical protein
MAQVILDREEQDAGARMSAQVELPWRAMVAAVGKNLYACQAQRRSVKTRGPNRFRSSAEKRRKCGSSFGARFWFPK